MKLLMCIASDIGRSLVLLRHHAGNTAQPPITTAGLPICLLEEEWGNIIKHIGRISIILADVIINSFTFCVIGSAGEEFRKDEVIQSAIVLRYLKDLMISTPFLRFKYPGSSSPASIPPYYIIAGSFICTARFWHYNTPLDAAV